jgi:hypothetical protein
MNDSDVPGFVCFACFAWLLLGGVGWVLAKTIEAYAGHRKRTAPARERARELARQRAGEDACRRASENARRRDQRQAARRQRREEYSRARQERAIQQEREREVQAARREAESFYRQHVDLLRDQVPEAFFKANMQTHFPEATTPEQAWAAARDVIAQLQPLLVQARERSKVEDQKRRRKEERMRALQAEIDDLRTRMTEVSRSPIALADPEFRESEIGKVERKIHELKEQKRLLEASNE